MRFRRIALASLLLFQVSCDEGFDLVIEQIGVPASVEPGQPFQSPSRVCNRASEPSGPVLVELSLRVSPAGPDLPLDSYGIPGLMAGQCHQRVSELVAPGGLPDGAYRVVGKLTPGGHEKTSGLFGIGWQPNLVVEKLEAPPSAEPFAPLVASGLVCNRGTQWAPPFSVALLLSSDLWIPGPRVDQPIGEVSLPGLPPDACAPFEQNASAPQEGLYLLGAIVDPAGNVQELREDDNARLLDLIAVGWQPDLVVTALDAPNATLNGYGFDVDARVCNQGTVWSDPTELALFFSEDLAITPPGPEPGDFPVGTLPVPSLPPGACVRQSGPVVAAAPHDGAWTLGAIVDPWAAVEELLEVNNAFAGPLMGVGNRPDLLVESIEAPPSAGQGQEFEASARVCNRGTTHSSNAMLRLFHSSDAELSPLPFGEDPEIGSSTVTPLAPGACENVWVGASSASMLSGAVYVIALADGFEELEELIETNNERVGPLMGIGWAPDLVVRSLAAPPSVESGAPFDVTVEVCNQGTEPSDPTLARVYHSADAVLSGIGGPPAGDDWYAGDFPVPALNPGACVPIEGDVTATPFAQGAHYLGATVDQPSSIDELIEMNNAHVGPLMGVGSGPDLVVTRIDAPPTSGFGPLTLDFEVCNQGTAASPPAQVSFYDSQDAVIEPDTAPPVPGSDRWLGAETYPGLAAGACHSGEAHVSLPPGVEGERRLGAVADEWNGVDELVEANNVFVGPVIGVGFGPDLVLTQVLAEPSVENGGFLEVDTRVCNQGTAWSPGVQVALFLSLDAEIEGSFPPPSPDPWLDTFFVPSLAPGSCHDEQAAGFAYVPFDGAWHVGGVVDPGAVVPELIESNNATTGGIVGVGHGPDLVISELTGPAGTPAGGSFDVGVEACNQGTAASTPTQLFLYHSEDAVIDDISSLPPPADHLLGNVLLPPLAPGGCHFQLKSVYASAPAAGFLAATVDEFMSVPELIETNNELLGPPLEITGP